MYHVLFFYTTTYYYSSKYLMSYPLVVYHIVCRYHFIHSTAALFINQRCIYHRLITFNKYMIHVEYVVMYKWYIS